MDLLGGVVAIAAVITPLGLYQTLEPGGATQTPFKYVNDLSPYGYGTPPRGNASFSRLCLDSWDYGDGLRACPFSDTVTNITDGSYGMDYAFPYNYNLSIPQVITDIYSSGTQDNTTVSNYFDIQWRQYLTTSNTDYDNGSTYTIGYFRYMESVLLNNAYEPVEGLVVDTVKGSIGFRNHTFPHGFQNGVTWEEDLLFIEPETVCIDTNLTLDCELSADPNNSIYITGVVLTDRGGFANLNHALPSIDLSDPQKNPDLYGRAYQAAWLNNAYTALYYDITVPFNGTDGLKPLSSMNSFIGKTYSMSTSDASNTLYRSLTIDPEFGGYIDAIMGVADDGPPLASSDSGIPTNPFNVTRSPFDSISESLLSMHCSKFPKQ
jgi:hypothetical protein